MQTATAAQDSTATLREAIKQVFAERAHLTPGFLDLCAREVVSRLRREMGGEKFYVPCADKAERDARMRAAFDSRRRSHTITTNLTLVTEEFNVSESTARRVCCS